jgi:hypothetical protein
MTKDKRTPAELIRELYLVALCRPPSEAETKLLLEHVTTQGKDARTAYADIIWALINSEEFLFNH